MMDAYLDIPLQGGRLSPPVLLPGPPPTSSTSTTNPASLVERRSRSTMNKKAKYGAACVVCKEDHKACDGGRPCSRCVSLGIAGSCKSSSRSNKSKAKEEGPFSGKLVFCLEEISMASRPDQGVSQPSAPAQPPFTTTTCHTQRRNFHYTTIPNTSVVQKSAIPTSNTKRPAKKAKVVQPSPTTPAATPTATPEIITTPTTATCFPSSKSPEPFFQPFAVPVAFCVEETKRVEVSTTCSPSVLDRHQPEEPTVDSQIALLKRQLEIEREKQNKLKLKLQLRREQLEFEQHTRHPFTNTPQYPSFQPQYLPTQQQPPMPTTEYTYLPPQQQPMLPELELLQPLHHVNLRKRKHVEKEQPNPLDGMHLSHPLRNCGEESRFLSMLIADASSGADRDERSAEEGDPLVGLEQKLMQGGWGWDSYCSQPPPTAIEAGVADQHPFFSSSFWTQTDF